LIFEAFLIFSLIAGYCAFWILKKRKLGSLQTAVPKGVVKNYLNTLILEAQGLRSQLFGLLADAGVQPQTQTHVQYVTQTLTTPASAQPSVSGNQDTSDLEAKLAAQEKAISEIESQKKK